jgi:hypothetical protein
VFTFFRKKPSRQDVEREQFLEALTEIAKHFATGAKAQAEAVSELAQASARQTEVFQSYIALFQTDSKTTSRVIRDEDEIEAELKRAGFPSEATPEEQLRWVYANTE